MDLGAAGLLEQPFPAHGKPLAIVSHSSREAALAVLRDTCTNPTGISLLQGPPLSGKSTLIRTFVESLHDDFAVAVIDGAGLNTTNLLISVLRQFGFDIELFSTSELLGLVRVFALQQAASDKPPLLIIESAHELNPNALRALCELSALRVRTCSALKMVLASDRSLSTMIAASPMEPISRRIIHDFHLRPMTQIETQNYLHAKLRAAGAVDPHLVFPDDICAELWNASGGWPGITDRVALFALARAKRLPVAVDEIEHPTLPSGTWDKEDLQQDDISPTKPPQLIVVMDGGVINGVSMENSRFLIGRSEHNDITIDSQFVSRHHAMLIREGASTFLIDLNSTNGTFVNSKRVSNHVLVHDEILTIGHDQIKFHDPQAAERDLLDNAQFAETAVMKTLADMRDLLAQKKTPVLPAVAEEIVPATSEDLPTIHI